MFEFITLSQNIPFAVSLMILCMIALLEGVGLIFGAGLSNILEGLLPEGDWVVDIDGPDIESHGIFGKLLSWLRVGKVPVIVLLIVFLAGFGISGLVLQSLLNNTLGFVLPAYIAVLPAIFLTLPVVRIFSGMLAKILPKDETDVVSSDSFVGKVAIITLGKASQNSPAQAKFNDQHGQTHYVMVEPDDAQATFAQGEAVILVKQAGAKFYAIKSTNDLMTNDE